MRQASPRIVHRKAPLDGDTVPIALVLPALRLLGERLLVRDAPVQALATEDAEFDLGHVQPAGVFGCVVKFQAA